MFNRAIHTEDKNYLNLGFGVNPGVGLQSNTFRGDLFSNNGCPITAQSYTSREADGNFWSLGGISGNQTSSNEGNTINHGTTAGVNSNLYTSHGGNIRKQTWPNNVSRVISGTNAGVNSTLHSIPETIQCNVLYIFVAMNLSPYLLLSLSKEVFLTILDFSHLKLSQKILFQPLILITGLLAIKHRQTVEVRKLLHILLT